jgi:aspartyl-tRNA(Asn)/glutamyl-tRNA(Gln) amidotransferase subunit C
MAVSVADVRHVASLARLGLTDERAEALTRDLNTILDHMAVLSRIDTRSVAEVPAVGGARMPLGADHGPAESLAERPEEFAPSTRGGFLLVPRLASHEDAEPAA